MVDKTSHIAYSVIRRSQNRKGYEQKEYAAMTVPMGRQRKCVCELMRGKEAYFSWYPHTGKTRYVL